MANELPVSLYDSNSASVGTASNPLVIDPSGSSSQPVTGTVTANQGGSWTVTIGAAIPAGSNTIGKVDQGAAGASAWPVKTEVQIDYDTGAGTQNLSIIGMALPASGGAVAGGTATNPIRVDPTGGTTQPVSGTVTSNQGTAAAGSGAWPVAITDTSNTVVKPGDASNNAIRVNVVTGVTAPVTQVDRSTFTDGTSTFNPVGGYFNDSATNPTSGQAATARITSKRAIHINLRDNSGNEIGTASAPVRTDPTGGTIQPVSGTVTANAGTGTFTIAGGKTNNNAAPGATNVGALVAIANAATPSWSEGNLVALSADLAGSVRASITNTVTVSGTVAATQSGTWNVGLSTGSNTIGKVDQGAGGASAWKVDGSAVTQPVSGTVTANQGGAPWSIIGSLTHNSLAPSANNVGVLSAVANVSAPSYNEGDQVLLSVDLSGNLRTSLGSSQADVVSRNGYKNLSVYDLTNRKILEQILWEIAELSRRIFDTES